MDGWGDGVMGATCEWNHRRKRETVSFVVTVFGYACVVIVASPLPPTQAHVSSAVLAPYQSSRQANA